MISNYARIRLPIEIALSRYSKWVGTKFIIGPTEALHSKVVELSCDSSGNWKGRAVFVFTRDGWTVIEDVSGGLVRTVASDWLSFAHDDELVVAGFDDSNHSGELLVVRKGHIVRHFLSPDASSITIDQGTLDSELSEPIQTWSDVAYFAETDPIWGLGSDSGLLLIHEGAAPTSSL